MNQPDGLRKDLESRTTDELVAILRNQNEDEWRPEVFALVASILAGRGISAAMVSAMGPEGEDVVEGRPLATVARYFSPAEAHAGRMALEGAGIQSWVADESLGTAYGVGVGTRLQVRVEDEKSALAVLASEPAPASTLPAELAEPPCPQCGSKDVSQSSEPIEDPDPARTRGGGRQWYYDCAACGHRWATDDEP
jgi:DNA-directed RNA polymerase subunit M/transcription elongation factor TFIIS